MRLGTSALAAAIGRVVDADVVPALGKLAAELRREYSGDTEAETIARQADLKRQRVMQEN